MDRVGEMGTLVKQLGEEQLKYLNRMVVDRLRLLDRQRQQQAASQWSVGDRVYFDSRRGQRVVGTIVRINTKTVQLEVPGTPGWRVAPSLLRKAPDMAVAK